LNATGLEGHSKKPTRNVGYWTKVVIRPDLKRLIEETLFQ